MLASKERPECVLGGFACGRPVGKSQTPYVVQGEAADNAFEKLVGQRDQG